MLFAFRGVRLLQVLLSIVATVMGVGSVLMLKAFTDGKGFYFLFPAFGAGLAFLWAFATTLRAPTSFIAIADERTRIRFAGFVDTVVANRDIVSAKLVKRSILSGIGVRANFRGNVALASTWGEAAELTLREPVRVWLVPRLIRVKATRLQVTVRNPAKLVERFGGAPERVASPGSAGTRKMKRRGPRTR